jgi:hypothetical protein
MRKRGSRPSTYPNSPEALIEVARRKAEQLRVEIRQDLEAASSYIAKHGSFAEMVRAHRHDNDKA